MKKLFVLFAFLFTLGVSAQSVRQITDQIEGVTVLQTGAVSGQEIVVSGKNPVSLSFDVLCTEIDGTSEGTLVLQARNDSDATWTTLNSDFSNQISFSVNDTLTVADAAHWKISIPDATFRYYQFLSSGGAGDTTQVDIWYMIRND